MTKFQSKEPIHFGPPARKIQRGLVVNCDHKGYGKILKGKKWHCLRCDNETN